MDYTKLLHDGFAIEKQIDDEKSRLAYLSGKIFDFTTDDSDMDELFALRAIEVCNAISEGTTLKYIKNKESYTWYLLMCNMPFFSERIEWGTTIRCAWWKGSSFTSCGLWDGDRQITELQFDVYEWERFIRAVIGFAKGGDVVGGRDGNA